jgi:hypothetical protein
VVPIVNFSRKPLPQIILKCLIAKVNCYVSVNSIGNYVVLLQQYIEI